MRKFVLAAAGLVATAHAQETVRKEIRTRTFEMPAAPGILDAGGGTVHFMAAGATAGKAVEGAPYTADSSTEYVRTLADGTRITRRTQAKFARDSRGRTRDEQTLPGLGPWASGEAVKLITIFDPVAKEIYILNEKEKTARKVKFGSGNASWSSTASSSTGSGNTREVRVERRVQVFHGGPGPAAGAMALPPMASADVLVRRGEAKVDQLGTQILEGLQVQGTRTTRTVPAGEMGNDRPLVSTEERWESTELKTVVRSVSHDPEFGDTTFRLNNINRAEPARSLFQIPPDYKIEEGPQAFRMELREKP